MEKLNYFLASFFNRLVGRGLCCPNCGEKEIEAIVSRKFFVTTLQRCKECGLLYRSPTTTKSENKTYYQKKYKEGFTTDLPSPEILRKLKESRFAGSEKDFSEKIKILKQLGLTHGSKVLDFGCSWGYGSWQFSQAGLDVNSFEISVPRANYAREALSVSVVSDESLLVGELDAFFSSHVLEHVPHVGHTIQKAFCLLKKGGCFVGLTPNGSLERRKVSPQSWKLAWGLKHPIHLDEVFYKKIFKTHPFYVASSPHRLELIQSWLKRKDQFVGDLTGEELLVIVLNQAFVQ